jgi:UDP-N-acetylglucosamine:LPS N-acetylglucosamine transferase
MNQPGKFLMLYLKTGGGHLAPAKAIAGYLKNHHSDVAEPVLVDCFEEAPRWLKFIVEDGYRITQSKAKWLFEFLYAMNKLQLPAKITCFAIGLFIKPYLKKVIEKEKPVKIVCLHFFILQPLFSLIKNMNLNTPIITLVTDPFTAHTMWFLNKKQNFILFSKKLGEKIKSRLPDSSINIFPFTLDEKYSFMAGKDEIEKIKSGKGIDLNQKVILIVGGGDGIPHGKRILKGILSKKINSFVIIICGKNKELFDQANQLKKQYQSQNLLIFGYVDFVYELINASDLVITKCGASTIMEILLLKKVPVVNDYIWEQEQGNVDFLIESKLGIYEPKLNRLPGLISELIVNNEKLNLYKSNIENMDLKNGLKEVSEFLINC